MTTEVIERTARAWSNEPRSAQGKSQITARSQACQSAMQSGTFAWKADLPEGSSEWNQAPSPTTLLLSALAGGAVVFIKDTLAPQMGLRVYSVEATASCETDSRGLLGIDGVEPDLRHINVDLRIESTDGEEAVQRLLEVWEQRGPVYLALIKPAKVKVSARVINWYEDA